MELVSMRRWTCLLLLVGSGGCLTEEDPIGGDVPPAVQAAFDANCVVSGCHDAGSRAANLSLEQGDSSDILGGPTPNSEFPLVQTGDVYGSYLALKLLDEPSISGQAMPLGGVRKGHEGEIALILAWIAGQEIPDDLAPLNPPTNPTFNEHVWPIIESNCSCHQDGGSGSSTVELDEDVAYMNIVDVAYGMRKFIDPGDLGNSQIWLAVTDTGGTPMPFGGPPLSGNELQTIRDWILDDAPE